MKKAIYVFCAAACALFMMVSCSKSDNKEPKRFDIPSEAKAIISEDFIAKMAANGMTLTRGQIRLIFKGFLLQVSCK